ncbi:glycosylphosphatidylinositol anchor biosynthesis [Toensbergia leucococca]|nr:glycosylphosphatidylinositol anchor biosynthesis [Toensbergia leucococca]
MSSTPTAQVSKPDQDQQVEQSGFRRRALDRAQEAATSQDILLFLIAFRILNALSIKTFFQPDEYFQSLEPAWQIAFGEDSGAWITWEWKHQLRSAVHPVFFAVIYWLSSFISSALKLSPEFRADLLIAAPKVTQAILAALGDYYTWKLAKTTYGNRSNEAWAVTPLLSYTCRSSLHPPADKHPDLDVSFLLRLFQLHNQRENSSLARGGPMRVHIPSRSKKPEISAKLSRSIILIFSTLTDRFYYQQWTFPPLRFLYFNIVQSLAVFYGRNDLHYYLSQGYPLMLTTFLPFALIGLYQSFFPPKPRDSLPAPRLHTKSIRYQLASTALFVPLTLSLVSHKEVRFIYPLLPTLHILAATPFTTFFLPALSPAIPPPKTTKRTLLLLLLLTNILLSILSTQYHQPAPLSLLSYLRTQHTTHYLSQPPLSSLPPAPTTMTVGLLTPCHSTPWRSHLVYPSLKVWALTCSPPINLNATARSTYLDEADQFYADPVIFLAKTLGPSPRTSSSWGRRRPLQGLGAAGLELEMGGWDGKEGRKGWPEYLVFFAQMEEVMGAVLRGSGYRECWRGWNGWGNEDWRRRGDLVIWCLRGGGGVRG